MHPRNIYKTPPNFDELRRLYPEFAEKIHVDVNGKIKLDFKDPEAVRILTKCCLKKDFNLNIEIPPDKLLPTLPLRINYILWIEDLLTHCGIKDEIVGIDIGTGACCIYCLLSVRLNSNWKMFALEIDKENVNHAIANIARNQLDEKVVVIDQEGSDKIFERLFEIDDYQKTFTICNPPFYTSKTEMTEGENRTGKRKRRSFSSMRESSETVFNDGGEYGFATKILNESFELRNKIEIYSTMFGCKKNFEKFLTLLKSHKIESITTTELVQGKVYRWAVAWSFSRNLDDFAKEVPQKSKNVLQHVIDNRNLTEVNEQILEILNNIKISSRVLKCESGKFYQYELKASENTWSNQRRKRRAEKRNESFDDPGNTSSQNLKMGFEINKIDNSVQISIFFLHGNMPKDSVNQILQFIKNNLKGS